MLSTQEKELLVDWGEDSSFGPYEVGEIGKGSGNLKENGKVSGRGVGIGK